MKIAEVPSQTDSTKSYGIFYSEKEQHFYCSCPAWKFQRKTPKERTCKHLNRFFKTANGVVLAN